MTNTVSAEIRDQSPPPAEELLARMRQLLLDRSSAFAPPNAPGTSPPAPSSHRALRSLEDTYGPAATQPGRRLNDLLHGSAAWDLFERPVRGRGRLPRAPDLTRCDPLLQVMRESGELAERERMLGERDRALLTIQSNPTTTYGERSAAARHVYDRYFAAVVELTNDYRPGYQELRRAVGTIPPLIAPRVRSRPMLQPPLMTRLFQTCHTTGDDPPALPEMPQDENRPSLRLTVGPTAAGLLDDRAWDIAAIAVCAFFVRTSGSDPAARFPLLVDDYFDWRGVDPRKRTADARREIDARIRLLCSADDLRIDMTTELWLPDQDTGRRRKTLIQTGGSFLARHSGLYRPTPWRSEVEDEPLYGHYIALADWARPFLEARAMIGVFPKRLAEYDLRRQQWERRIGWYLTFQMQNQRAKMSSGESDKKDATPARVVLPHSLKMRTILQNSRAPWEEMARTNPGKVIRQWVDTLETLRRDGLLASYACLDGAVDGSDLPLRNRLNTMLEHRYVVAPGADLARPARPKPGKTGA